MKILALSLLTVACLGCALFAPGGRYGPRDKNCVVKRLPSAPQEPIDDLGMVTVDCWTGNDDGCEQEIIDEVCRRGGDVVWDLGAMTPSTTKIAVHVGRTRRPVEHKTQ
jgi:hypothetical protein